MNRRLITPALLLLLVAALLLPSCNPFSTNTNSSTQPYRFGAVIPLTGPGAALGGLIRRGIELGVEDVNNGKAADKQIGVVFEDSKTVPNEGLTAFRKLVDVDKVSTVLVGFSTVCNAVAPVAEESKILMIGMTTSLPGLTDGRNYVIRFFPNADMLAGTMADYASTRFSRVAVIYAEDEYGKSAFTTFSSKFQGSARTIVFSESFKPTDTDFRSIVAKMAAANPDGIFLPGYGPGYITLINQIRERNATIPIMGDSPLTNPPVYKAAGNAVEGVIVPATPLDAGIAETPEQKAFFDSYRKRFNENPSINVTINYDFVHLLALALENTDKSPGAIRQYFLRQSPYKGLTGEIRFQPNGESIVQVRPMAIEGSTIVQIKEPEKAKQAASGK
jgi:branched-chain amino acid transport system substrate-binding protein